MGSMRQWILIVFLMLTPVACSPAENEGQMPQPSSTLPPETDIPAPSPIPATTTPEPANINSALIPSGFLWADSQTDLVTLSNKQGEHLQELQIPNYSVGQVGAPAVHTSGSVSTNLDSANLFFQSRLSYVTSFEGHNINPLLVISPEIIPNYINRVAVPGTSMMAVGLFDINSLQAFRDAQFAAPTESAGEATSEPVSIQSWIYAHSSGNSNGFEEVLSRAEDGNVLRPIAIKQEAHQMIGIWYVLKSEGITGIGPMFFKGYSRLYYLDLGSNHSQEVTTPDQGNTLSISPDTTLIALADFSIEDKPLIVITNLTSGESIKSIPALPNTVGFNTNNSGSVHFSPSNHRIAWAGVIRSGDEISMSIQVTSLLDETTFGFSEQDLNAKFSNQEYHTFNVSNWLDDECILIEAKYEGGVDLFSMRFDGAESQYLAPGHFLGLTYP